MEMHNKTEKSLSKIKEKLKRFLKKALQNKKDATLGQDLNEESYRKAHENLKMY